MRRERLVDDLDTTDAESIKAHSAAVEAEYRRRSVNDFELFYKGLTIPGAHGPQVFGSVIAPFQEECFKLLEPSLRAVRDGAMPPRRRFWLERTKKAGKDSDLAVCVLWLLAFSKRPILIQISAANQQQAGIVKRRIEDILFYNPWLKDIVSVQRNRILGYRGVGVAVIEATDSAKSTDKASGTKQGDTPDLLILNELVHVAKWGVNVTHMNNADGVPQGVAIISTNAGIKGTKPWQWRVNALSSLKRWTVHIFDKVAPWISDEDVQEAKNLDPVGLEHARLWQGQWISGVGGVVDELAIDKCFIHDGPLSAPESGWIYVAGLDLGVSKDHAAIVMLGANYRENRIKVGWLRAYVPSVPNDRGVLEVDIDAVKQDCHDLSKLFRISWFGYDPAVGGSFIAQQLRKMGLPMKDWPFTLKNRTLMAEKFVTSLKGNKLECYEDREGRLRRDFGKFRVIPKLPTGYVLEAVSDEWGHADVGTALVICLPKAVSLLGGSPLLGEDEVLFDDAGPLTEEEQKTMPESLAGIIDAYDGLSKQRKRKRLSTSYTPKGEDDDDEDFIP
jgi:hypothetical protein